MICPKCKKKSFLTSKLRGPATLVGAGAGGYLAATAGAGTSAMLGTLICPVIGTAIGGMLGILTGAAGGATAGNTVGKLLDENVIRQYRCPNCGYTWRAA